MCVNAMFVCLPLRSPLGEALPVAAVAALKSGRRAGLTVVCFTFSERELPLLSCLDVSPSPHTHTHTLLHTHTHSYIYTHTQTPHTRVPILSYKHTHIHTQTGFANCYFVKHTGKQTASVHTQKHTNTHRHTLLTSILCQLIFCQPHTHTHTVLCVGAR